MKSLPRSPAHQSFPLMCQRGSHTLLSPIRQNRAGAVDLMTLTSRNGTRSSASSVATVRSPSGVRAEHTWVGSGRPLHRSRCGALNGLATDSIGLAMTPQPASASTPGKVRLRFDSEEDCAYGESLASADVGGFASNSQAETASRPRGLRAVGACSGR